MEIKDKDAITVSEMKKQEVVKKLQEQNYRITKQRMMLLDIILQEDCSCCKEIYFKVSRIYPKIGAATVYRMINTLEDIGVINRKKLYQIECTLCNEEKGMCRIILDDQSEVELDDQKWKQVITCGLKCCGMIENQNLKQIQLHDNNISLAQ